MESDERFVFLKGIENQKLRQKVVNFYNSLTIELETFGISLQQLLQCKLLIVKEDEGKIVGMSGLLKGNYTFFVVKNEYQSQRIGTMLIEEVVKWAHQANYNYVMGNTLVSNEKMNILWRKVGARILYVSVIGGREHYLWFISFNWRGLVYGSVVKILGLIKPPKRFLKAISNALKVFRST